MDGSILDPDSARERLNTWKSRIDKLAADTRAMSDQIKDVRVTASDPNGLAEVTIDSTGALVGLQLTNRIQRVAPDAVAAAIMAALEDARSKLADRSQEIIADTVGTVSPAARAIAESVGQQLRGASTEERTTSSEEDDDYGTRSYLERW